MTALRAAMTEISGSPNTWTLSGDAHDARLALADLGQARNILGRVTATPDAPMQALLDRIAALAAAPVKVHPNVHALALQQARAYEQLA